MGKDLKEKERLSIILWGVSKVIIFISIGKYFFENGDYAEGDFEDNVEGDLRGHYKYKWRDGK